jgi:hypothetical protein
MSVAWAAGLAAVLAEGGKSVNLAVSWRGADESPAIRGAIDDFLAERRTEHLRQPKSGWRVWSVETVANTIFPIDLYFPQKGDGAIQHFTDLYLEGREFARSVSPEGEYCERLVAWPGPTGKVNQLELVAAKLRRIRARDNGARGALSSEYEVAIDHTDDAENLRIQVPGLNNGPYGFPCLSHISLTIHNGELHLTALYRNQHLVRRAYGNYLGLTRLASAMANEAGLPLGEVMVIATHADVGLGETGFGKAAIQSLLAKAGGE